MNVSRGTCSSVIVDACVYVFCVCF